MAAPCAGDVPGHASPGRYSWRTVNGSSETISGTGIGSGRKRSQPGQQRHLTAKLGLAVRVARSPVDPATVHEGDAVVPAAVEVVRHGRTSPGLAADRNAISGAQRDVALGSDPWSSTR